MRAYLSQMGEVAIDKVDWNEIENNDFFCPDVDKVAAFDELIRELKKKAIQSAPKSKWLLLAFQLAWVSLCLIA